jgi:hypothetical protein
MYSSFLLNQSLKGLLYMGFMYLWVHATFPPLFLRIHLYDDDG